jgi:hypothetical protein
MPELPELNKNQDVLDFEAELVREIAGHSAHSITGNELIALIQQLPPLVSHMSSPEDPVARSIISCTAQLLKEYPNNYEVHLTATFAAISELRSEAVSEVRELISAVAHKVTKLNRPFTDAETWSAITSLRYFSSSHPETLSLVKAITSKVPVGNTKIEFTHVDSMLSSLAGLGDLNSDCLEVQQLILAINVRLRHKKGKVKFFSSFQGE